MLWKIKHIKSVTSIIKNDNVKLRLFTYLRIYLLNNNIQFVQWADCRRQQTRHIGRSSPLSKTEWMSQLWPSTAYKITSISVTVFHISQTDHGSPWTFPPKSPQLLVWTDWVRQDLNEVNVSFTGSDVWRNSSLVTSLIHVSVILQQHLHQL